MKYGDLNLGQIEAIVNKLGGMDGVRRFLSGELVVKAAEFLKFVAEVAVGGTERFVAAGAFGANNPDGIKFYLSHNFKTHFFGKIEENVESVTIAIHRLEKSSRDPEIMTELGPEKRVIKLAHFYEMFKAQANGQEGRLLVDGCANIAYIEDEDGTLWAVGVLWNSFRREWRVDADSVEDPSEWGAGRRVFSRK